MDILMYDKIDKLKFKYPIFSSMFDHNNLLSLIKLGEQIRINEYLFEYDKNIEKDWYIFLYEIDTIYNNKQFYNIYKHTLISVIRKDKIKYLNENR